MDRPHLVNLALGMVRGACNNCGAMLNFYDVMTYIEELENSADDERRGMAATIRDLEAENCRLEDDRPDCDDCTRVPSERGEALCDIIDSLAEQMDTFKTEVLDLKDEIIEAMEE